MTPGNVPAVGFADGKDQRRPAEKKPFDLFRTKRTARTSGSFDFF